MPTYERAYYGIAYVYEHNKLNTHAGYMNCI